MYICMWGFIVAVLTWRERNRWQAAVVRVCFPGSLSSQHTDSTIAKLNLNSFKGLLCTHYQQLSMTAVINISKLCYIVTHICFANTHKAAGIATKETWWLFFLLLPPLVTHLDSGSEPNRRLCCYGWLENWLLGSWGKQAHDRLVCGPPPGFHPVTLRSPFVYPLPVHALIPTPCLSFVSTLSSKLKTT